MRSLTWQEIGLAVFVVTAIGIHLVLLYDLWLRVTGRMMITDYCRENPWAAWGILAVLEVGVLGLAVHFMAPVLVDR